MSFKDLNAIQSAEDFNKAKRSARFQSLMSTLTWKNSDLLSLYEVTSIIKPRSETYRGMQTIPVKNIIGSESRYRDFSSAFMPKKEMLRRRWTSIDSARIDSVILPPISVYSLGGYYFVRDGNHRVSVAKAMGQEFIDAEVVELDSQVHIEPGMTLKQIKASAVAYERAAFIRQYKPDYLPMNLIVFTAPGAYPEMVNHILVHKYYINQNVEGEISFEDAARSWYDNVYHPIVEAIKDEGLLVHFPGNTEADLYMWLVRKWDNMKRDKKDATIREAAEDLKKETAKGTLRRWFDTVRQFFSRH